LDAAITDEKLIDALENPEKVQATSVFLSEEQTDDVVSFEEELITPIELNVTTAEQIDEAIAEEDPISAIDETLENNEVAFTPSIQETQKTIDEDEEELEEIVLKNPIEDAQEAVERATLEIEPVSSIHKHETYISLLHNHRKNYTNTSTTK